MKDQLRTIPAKGINYGKTLSICLLISISGFIGGAVSQYILAGHLAKASPSYDSNVINVPNGGLIFKTPDGKTIAKIDKGENGGSFILYNKDEKPSVGSYSLKTGGSVSIFNNPYSPAVSVFATDTGGSFFITDTRRGKRIIEMSPYDDGGNITISHDNGESAVILGIEKLKPKITLINEDHQITWKTP